MTQKSNIPVDPDFGPNDAELGFHDRRRSGAEPKHAAEGSTTPGTSGRPPLTETPEGSDAVEDAKFLADAFDMPANQAADLATANRGDDAERVRDEVIELQKDEQDPLLEGNPLPEQPDEAPDQPNTMQKPVADRSNDREGAG